MASSENPHLSAVVSAASSSSTVVDAVPAASLAEAKKSTRMETAMTKFLLPSVLKKHGGTISLGRPTSSNLKYNQAP